MPNQEEVIVDEKPPETMVEFLASLPGLLVVVLFIMTFVLQNFEIPSSSMEDTLLIGDHLFVNREQFAPPTRWMGPLMPYRDIRRNDVAVFLSSEQPGLFLVKRIIGIPGDHIRLRDGVVYRNLVLDGTSVAQGVLDRAAPDSPQPRQRESSMRATQSTWPGRPGGAGRQPGRREGGYYPGISAV